MISRTPSPANETTKTTVEGVKQEVEKVTKKPVAKKPVAKKPAAKKPAAKKPATAKEIKVNTIIQYYGNQITEKEIVNSVKKAWRSAGNKVGDIKTMDIYVKPEDYSVYYVINGTETGSVPF